MTMGMLMCADPLSPRRVDPHFEREWRAVRELDGQVALIDHDALTAGRIGEAVSRVPKGFGTAWYRGWIIGAARYGCRWSRARRPRPGTAGPAHGGWRVIEVGDGQVSDWPATAGPSVLAEALLTAGP
jgi:hypothetical protein